MCYLIARDRKKRGCYALNTEHGENLVKFKRHLQESFVKENYDIELVTISRPSAYGEYEPYIMIDTENEFEEKVKDLC